MMSNGANGKHQQHTRLYACRSRDNEPAEPKTSVYAKVSSLLSWRMIQTVLRVWLDVVDTDGKQKKTADWQLQEVSLKALRCTQHLCTLCCNRTPFTLSIYLQNRVDLNAERFTLIAEVA